MALSWKNYLSCVNHFLNISNSIGDGWDFVKISNEDEAPENCYLKKQVIEQVYSDKNKFANYESLLEENIEHDLSSVQGPSTSLLFYGTLIWEYHLLYSPSYSVPVMYFNTRYSSGKLLPLDEVWKIVNVPENVLIDKWSFVSQKEHPILLRPFFFLHPCQSIEFLKISICTPVNPLITWLSSIANVVHLTIPLDYGMHEFKALAITSDTKN